MGKGGGGSPQPSSQTVNQSNLPEYARPYFEDIMNRGTTVSNTAYQPYGGQRVADFTPLQQQGFQGVQNLGPSSLNAPAAGMTGAAGLGGLFAGQNYAQQATSPGAMQSYMSPYMQNVVDFQKTQAVNDYGRQLPGQQAAASRAGAFGGSRQAIVESEAQRNLQNTLGGIQAQGTQQAYDQANKNLQFGSQLGLQGLGLAGQMGQQFGQLGQTAFGQQAATASAQQQAGAVQQAQNQQGLDKRYEEFMQQKTYPQEQLQFLSSLLRGSVVSPQQTQYQYQAPPSAASQIGGLGLGALGLSKAFGAKDGGEVPGYAEGGITGGEGMQGATESAVTDAKKQLLSGMDPRQIKNQLAVLIALQDRSFVENLQLTSGAKNQQALDAGRQQAEAPSIYDEQVAGLGGLDAGAMEEPVMAAGGGIIAFQDAGSVNLFSAQDVLPEDLEEARRQGRSPYTPEGPKERAARIRALQQARAASSGIGAAPASAAPASAAGNTPSLLSRGLGAIGRVASSPFTASAGLMSYSPEAGAGSDVVPGKLAGRLPTSQEIDALLREGRISDSEAREMLRKVAAAPAVSDAAQNQRELNRLPPPVTQQAPAAPAARPAATSAPAIKPAVDEFAALRKTVADQEKKLQTEDQAETARRDAYKKAMPDDLQQRLDTYKSEAAQAVEERDKDRWLAVAMGGFAAAAGESPYALKNFAQGLGLTTKEIASVNKDFRKLDQERNKLMREEQRLDRAEKMGIEKDIFAARDRATARRDSFDQYKTTVDLSIAKIATDKWKTLEEGRSRERVAGIYSSSRESAGGSKAQMNAMQIRYNQLANEGKGNTPEAKELLTSIENLSKAVRPPRENTALQIVEAVRGGRSAGKTSSGASVSSWN